MSGAESIGLQEASERLARIASSVPAPFHERATDAPSMEYVSIAKAIGERLASGVIFDGNEKAATPSDLLEAITAAAGTMLPVDNPNRLHFLRDETAVAYAVHVYQACLSEQADLLPCS